MTDQEHLELLRSIGTRGSQAEAAMTQLYGALSSSVFAFVRRRMSAADDHEVQAVVVDALYQVWCSAPNFAGNSTVKTWVLGIARHKLLDAVRSNPNSAHRHEDVADHTESLADSSVDLLTELAAKQRAQGLQLCMDLLPADQREALHLLLVEGMSVADIALVQACPCGTVKSRVFHAKNKLKALMANWLRGEAPSPCPQVKPFTNEVFT